MAPAASAAPKPSRLRQLASVAAAAAVIGVASLAGSGLLGVDSGTGFEPGKHLAPVASTPTLLEGESSMRAVAPGQRTLSPYAQRLQPAYRVAPQQAPSGHLGGGSLARFQGESEGAPSLEVPLGFELR